ncbi:MAG: glycosyltransferase family 4 protein [Geminicoccaceae bacterium]
MSTRRRLVLAYPGDLATRTGGYLYDRRLARELEARGWSVDRLSLGGGFPFPSQAQLAIAEGRLAALPEGTIVLLDGLALGAMPRQAERARARLDLVALVHHPLCLETGLSAADAEALENSERAALAAVRSVVVTSPRTAGILAELMAVPEAAIAVAPPGTDHAPLAAGSSDGVLRLLSVGTVIARKAHALLVEALSDVPGRWELTIAGSLKTDPATAERLRAAICAAGLTGRVHLAGELSSEALAGLYDRSDLFVSASLYEGYGMALAVALARGLPIVAAAGGAVAETVPATAGLLVPPGDRDALRTALTRCTSEPTLLARLREGAIMARARLPRWPDTAARVERALLGSGA